MRRKFSLPIIKTVLHFLCALGLFFIVGSANAQNDAERENRIVVALDAQQLESNNRQLYHQGLQAYLKEDFQMASTVWLDAVKNGHAKSAFNIARMWQEGQMPGQEANLQQAEKYFVQAARAGYMPAQAYLESNGQANNLAQKTQNIEPKRQSVPAINTASTNKNVQKKAIDKIIDYWSIQIFASKDLNQVKKMIEENNIDNQTTILIEKVSGITWYKLVYGKYSSHKDASSARDKLPNSLRVAKPWIRMVKS